MSDVAKTAEQALAIGSFLVVGAAATAILVSVVPGDPIGTTRWTGVSLQRRFPDLGLLGGPTHLRVSSVDGFFEVVDLAVVRIDDRIGAIDAREPGHWVERVEVRVDDGPWQENGKRQIAERNPVRPDRHDGAGESRGDASRRAHPRRVGRSPV